MSIIQHDVRRLDRLISDISDASSSMRNSRARMRSRGYAQIAQAVVSVANERRHENDPVIALTIESGPGATPIWPSAMTAASGRSSTT